MDDPTLIAHAERMVGESVERTVFRAHHLSLVLGLQLRSGQQVVAKARVWEDRLAACSRLHEWMAERFPCARPIGALEHVDGEAVSIEVLLGGGRMLPRGAHQGASHATWLQRFVAVASGLNPVPNAGSVPWLDWSADRNELWPMPDDRADDLNETTWTWIDDDAARARDVLTDTSLACVVGHGDWESYNLAWIDGELLACFDFDSVVLLPEAAVAGGASVVFPACGESMTATVAESAEFLRAYEAARRRAWDTEERRVAWAASVWLQAFNAKKESIDGDGPLQQQMGAEREDRTAMLYR